MYDREGANGLVRPLHTADPFLSSRVQISSAESPASPARRDSLVRRARGGVVTTTAAPSP